MNDIIPPNVSTDPVAPAPVTPVETTQPPATSGQPSAPAATSGSPAPTTGPSATQPDALSADQAFEALLREQAAEASPDAPAAAPEPTPTTPQPHQEAEPADSDPEDALEHLAQEPAPANKLVPYDKLFRALESRKVLKVKAETLERELHEERTTLDRVFDRIERAGITADHLVPFLNDLAVVKADPVAQQRVLQRLGIQAPAAPAASIDMAALRRHVDAYDLDGVRRLLDGHGQSPEPEAQPVARSAPPAPAPAPRAEPANEARGYDPVAATLAPMAQTVRAFCGDTGNITSPVEAVRVEAEIKRVSLAIDTVTKQHLQELRELGVTPDRQAIAKLFLKAQRTVLATEHAKRSASPAAPTIQSTRPQQTLRPLEAVSPRKKTADEMFEDLIRNRS